MKKRRLFYNAETGDRFKDLWLGLKKACRQDGLEHVNWHTFRHTFATRIDKSSADSVTLKELLGLSDAHSHTSRGAKTQAVRSLAAGGAK